MKKVIAGGAALILLGLAGLMMIMVLMMAAIFSGMDADNNQDTQNHNGATINGVKYADIINKKAAKYDISPALIAAVIKQESAFKVNASSSAGAIGLMQLMPGRCRDFGYSHSACKKPKNNIGAGTSIMAGNLQKYDQHLKLALAAYNAGPGNVAKYNGVPPFPETQHYVKQVPKYYKQFKKKLENGKIPSNSDQNQNPGGFIFPVQGSKSDITSPFAMRWGQMHEGIDIGEPPGTPIYAAKKGKVIRAKGDPGGFGYYIDIKHPGGKVTRYGHMYQNSVQVHAGQKVQQGQQIATVGANGHSTGFHLHFEMHVHGNPTNPMPYLP